MNDDKNLSGATIVLVLNNLLKASTILTVAVFVAFLVGNFVSAMRAQPSPSANGWLINPTLLTNTNTVNICTLPGGPSCSARIVWLCYADLSTNATSTTVSIFDLQATPVGYAQSVAIAGNTLYSPLLRADSTSTCRPFPGGLTIAAGNANALSFQMSGKYSN